MKLTKVLLISFMVFACLIANQKTVSAATLRALNANKTDIIQGSVEMPKDYNNLTEEQVMQIKKTENLHDIYKLNANSGIRTGATINGYVGPTTYSVPIVTVRQATSYYCGPAATLQVILSKGRTVPGSNNTEKQKTLAKNAYLGTDRDGATWINNVPAVLNAFAPSQKGWEVYKTTSNTNVNVALHAQYNHSKGEPVIYLVKTNSLAYYGNLAYYHYITGYSITSSSSGSFSNGQEVQVGVADPIDASQFGLHTVTYTELLNAMVSYTLDRGPANMVW